MSIGHKTFNGIKLLVCSILVGVCLFGGVLGAGKVAFATDSTLTITLSENAVTANVAPMATPSGTFIESSGMTIGVSTNNATGYELKISAGDTTTPGRLKLNNGTAYLQSLASTTSLSDFRDIDLSGSNLATSLGLSDCTEITESSNCKGIWGYKPSKLNSSINTNFLSTPGTSGNTLDTTSEPNTTPNEYTIALGAKVSPLATIGTYTNTFIVTATGNPITYTVSYYENIAEDMPADESNTTSSTTINLSDTAPTRAGYKFTGWCDQPTTKSGNNDTCTGTTYQPGASYTLDVTGTVNNIKLYAMWKPVTYMQDLTSTTIASLLPSVGSTAIVKDKRDQQDYIIAKLADNKYWMVENLNLAGGTALSADDTDVTSAYISGFSTSNNLTKTGDTIVLPASSASGFSSNNYSYVYNSGNKTNCGAYGQNTPCYSYYSWDAATLGSGRSISTDNTDAPHSICPKGWKLPATRTTSASNWQTSSDFYQLAHKYGLDSTTSDTESDDGFYTQAGPGTIPNFLLAGYHYYGSFSYGGSSGYYWSSTSGSSTSNARALYFSSSYVGSANYYERLSWFSVRCLFSGQ